MTLANAVVVIQRTIKEGEIADQAGHASPSSWRTTTALQGGVVRALNACGQVEILAEAEDGRAALAAITEHRPDVA